ncbi:hypothetical protein O3Q52_38070 [Streptomyces sp. ActVer]|uniref:hypothetical protein n=1 Tax=Streptomyces sp. ActVer TaxID=3014558 RepID=UPI0022B4D4F4|nr:hypothetical protein [Streptomyces sp. ActVer]MCZ4513846.1 hypothetical protein [Streptomyces sp. ActVer]
MRLTRKRLAVGTAGAVTALLAVTGCGSEGSAEKKVPETASGSLEQIASEAGCKPDMQTDADTIRQAICKSTDGKYVLATFATDRGQREWLNGAKDYGGYYLVGRKWVAVGEKKMVTALRGQLGGIMEEGSEHMNMDDHGSGASDMPSSHKS